MFQQVFCAPHIPRCAFHDELEMPGVKLYPLVCGNPFQLAPHLQGLQGVEGEVLAPGSYGEGYPVSLRGAQDYHQVGWRLLQELQHGAPRLLGKHVGLVYDVDLAVPQWAEVGPSLKLPDIVNSPELGSVYLYHVPASPLPYAVAGGALPAGLARPIHRGAVEGHRQDAGRRGLARSRSTVEEIGVVEAPGPGLVLEYLDALALAEDLLEPGWPVSGVEVHFLAPSVVPTASTVQSIIEQNILLINKRKQLLPLSSSAGLEAIPRDRKAVLQTSPSLLSLWNMALISS